MDNSVSRGVTSYYRSSDGPEVQVFEMRSVFADPANEQQVDLWIKEFEIVFREYMKGKTDQGQVYLSVIDVSNVRHNGEYNYNVVNKFIDCMDNLERVRPGFRIGFFYETAGLAMKRLTDRYEPESTLGKIGKFLGEVVVAGSLITEGSRLKHDTSNDWVRILVSLDIAIDWVRESGEQSHPSLPRY